MLETSGILNFPLSKIADIFTARQIIVRIYYHNDLMQDVNKNKQEKF